jgi:hypothetical protein
MTTHRLPLAGLRPFFAEVPYYLWGQVNYDSDGRWIMHSVVVNDPRAVNLCIDWLRGGPAGEPQSVALRYALTRLTGLTYATDKEWVAWYDGGGSQQYPEPDFDQWYAELQAQVVIP